MNDKKKNLIMFLLVILISLFGAFIGKVIAVFIGIKSVYGILIGFFVPMGIKVILDEDRDFFEDMIQNIGMFIFLLVVPTFGLAILVVPLIGIAIVIIVAVVKGVKEMTRLLLEFLSSYYSQDEIETFQKNQSKDKKAVKSYESTTMNKEIVKIFENGGKDMNSVKSFENCDNNTELLLYRIDKLRENIARYSNGELTKSVGSKINVDWNWINYFEVRLDNERKGNIRIEIWIADVKHQWTDLSKVSSFDFVSKQEPTYLINGLDINAEHYIGAYIKLGDSYGKTLAVTDYEANYVKLNFNKQYYKEFYNTIGGQWKKDLDKDDFIKKGKLLTEEIQRLPLINKDNVINYIKNETRNVINLSLGTTVNISIPINELAKKDINFNYEKNIDELAKPLYDFIIEYKNKIES